MPTKKPWMVVEVTRLKSPEHGIDQVSVPSAQGNNRLTKLAESLVIDWLKVPAS